jgi:DNA helicase-2/ATP-dependent DNA helicase PcrA
MQHLSDLLGPLNALQRQAVITTQGHVLVLAGPGSGKTRVLACHIAYLIMQGQVPADRILAVAFASKAADELRDRLKALVGENIAKAMTICTFHSLCLRILREEAKYLAPFGLTSTFTVQDSLGQMRNVKQTMRALDINWKNIPPGEICEAITQAKNEMTGPEELTRHAGSLSNEIVARVYTEYQKRLRMANSMDFGDLLWMTEYLLRSQPGVLLKLQQRWPYIHIDEFQDVNKPQYQVLRLLGCTTAGMSKGQANVYAVGDDDQLIYSWRGARAETILQNFERDFKQASIIVLEQDYRNSQTILEAALGIVQQNRQRREKRLVSSQGPGDPVVICEQENEKAEALYVAEEIRGLISRGQIKRFGEVAVMYRMNALSRPLEDVCVQTNIPFVVAGSSFYARQEVLDVLAYLRVLMRPDDEASLQRIISRKIGPAGLDEIQIWASQQGSTLYAALLRAGDHPTLPQWMIAALLALGRCFVELTEALDTLTLSTLLDALIKRSGYEVEVQGMSERDERQMNILELRRLTDEYAGQVTARESLASFLQHVSRMSRGEHNAQTERNAASVRDKVSLMTLHQAKGLEFPVVFIVGLDEGTLPCSKALCGEIERLEEERRLLYVGATRAMRSLYFVLPRRRSLQREVHFTMPSRFLQDIPASLVVKNLS